MSDDEDVVHVGHTLTRFPADLENATTYDNHACVLVGNDLASAIPVVLPVESFQCTDECRCLTSDAIVGVNGHGTVGGPALHSGPHAQGTADTSAIRVRRAMLLPPSASADILVGAPKGAYSLVSFWANLIHPGLNDADAAVQALWGPVRDWFRVASTNDANGYSLNAITPVTSASPLVQARLNGWVALLHQSMLTAAG